MNNAFISIEPQYADPDVFCIICVGTPFARVTTKIYIDLGELVVITKLLRASNFEGLSPVLNFDLSETMCFNFGFQISCANQNRTIRATFVDDSMYDWPIRAAIDIPLSDEESIDLAAELEEWISSPTFHFIWTKRSRTRRCS